MPRGEPSRKRRAEATTEVSIPDKLYFRIGEVSKLTATKAYVLRYWETEFPALRPAKSRTGHRLYRKRDVERVLEIRRLLYGQGFTIDGARRKLSAGTGESDGKADGKALLRSRNDGAAIRSIRRDLQGILTMLSRKC